MRRLRLAMPRVGDRGRRLGPVTWSSCPRVTGVFHSPTTLCDKYNTALWPPNTPTQDDALAADESPIDNVLSIPPPRQPLVRPHGLTRRANRPTIRIRRTSQAAPPGPTDPRRTPETRHSFLIPADST
jgi:hypothetical protein